LGFSASATSPRISHHYYITPGLCIAETLLGLQRMKNSGK
jgi:hypothetical protein